MFIGTPTQRFTVIVDTGSSIVSVPGSGYIILYIY